jgi:hypothetical protein
MVFVTSFAVTAGAGGVIELPLTVTKFETLASNLIVLVAKPFF